MFIRKLTAAAVFGLLLMACPASAGVLEELVADLKPVDGYVVLPVRDEFLIDLDARHGLTAGDLLAVIQSGEPIIHPVTGAVLGSLDVRKALLQVTRVKEGFSHARPVDGGPAVARGDRVRRYGHLRASFLDYTGRGEAFFAELAAALPEMEWQDYAAAQAERPERMTAARPGGNADLLVALEGRSLSVRDGFGRLLYAYPAPDPNSVEAAPSPTPYRLDSPLPDGGAGSVRYKPSFPTFKTAGPVGFAAVAASFVRHQEQLLMAASDGTTIAIFAADERLQSLTELKPDGIDQVASLCWWQPEPGTLYLAVTGWKQPRISSALYLYRDGDLVTLAEGLPFMLGSFNRDGDDRKELLLAQNFDRDLVWGTLVRQVALKENGVDFAPAEVELPRRFTVTGSLMADITGDGKAETIFIRDGLLYVFSGRRQLYRSTRMMGGSLSRFLFEKNPHARDTLTGYATFEVAPVAADLEGDGVLELLSVASDGSLSAVPGIASGVKKSWISVLKKRDGMFVKGELGEALELPMQGLYVDADRVLFLATETGSVFGVGGESQLLIFPLGR